MALYFYILATIFLRYAHAHSNYCGEYITFQHTPTPLKLTLSNLKKLGSGSYGAAYLDEDTNTVYKKNAQDDNTTKEYVITSFFSNEKIIIQTKGLFLTEPDKQLVIGLETCSGGSIDDKKMSETDLLELYSAMRSAFITLNKKCVAHNDVHTQNILICDGEYKLADFGEAVRTTKDNKTLAADLKYLGMILFERCDVIYNNEGCKHHELNKILNGLLHIDEKERLKLLGIEHENTHANSNYCGEHITFQHTPTPLNLKLSNLKTIEFGGYGSAFLDEDTSTVYKTNENDDHTTKEYIITSFFSNGKLTEKNIIQTKGLFLTEPDNQLVIGLENCLRGSIDNKKMSETDLLELYSAMQRAFITLDDKCVAHNNVQTQNILICDGQYKLANFGVAVRTTKDNKTLAADLKNLGMILFEKYVNDSEIWGDLSKKMNDEIISDVIHEGCKHRRLSLVLNGLLQIDEKKRVKFLRFGPDEVEEGSSSKSIVAIVICSVFGIFFIGALIYYFFVRKQFKTALNE